MDKRPDPTSYPTDKEQLLREFALAAQLKEIRDVTEVKHRLVPTWWEALIGVVQFAAALGLLASLMQHPSLNHDLYGRLAVFWMALMVLSLIMGFEFVIFRLHHLRRANALQMKMIEQMATRLHALEEASAQGQPQTQEH